MRQGENINIWEGVRLVQRCEGEELLAEGAGAREEEVQCNEDEQEHGEERAHDAEAKARRARRVQN